MRDLEEIIENYGMLVDQVKNITESTFHIGNSIIEFFGTDNLGKVHGPARDILFINECNYVKYDAFDQLAIRTKGCVFLDFNPTREFWYHTEIVGKIPYEFVQSTYLDNEFLTAAQIERIEAKKNNENWWRVYGLGELGRLEGAILQNWEFGDFDYTLPYGYGLDFGVKDPDALVRVAVDKANKRIYWREEMYQNNLSTIQLGAMIKSRVIGNKLIVADSQATRTILDLKGQGVNIRPVKKNPIVEDIKMLLDWQIIVDPESFNLQKELNNWIWLDKKGEIPLDADNHCFIGNTLISTDKGQIRIDELNGTEYILTTNGFRPLIKIFNNGIKQTNKYLIQFDTFSLSLCCTPSHLIKTTKGWIQISKLRSGMDLHLNKNLMGKYTGYIQTNDIFQEEQKECISQYGNTIMEKFKRVFLFITEMKILGTIESIILSLKKAICIFENTERKDVKIKNGLISFILGALKRLKNGIRLNLGENGIPNMVKNHGLIDNMRSNYVNFAEKNILPDNQLDQNFVLKTVRLVIVEESSSNQVYDLMVKEDHEYFANGILVHNCIDAARYYSQTVIKPIQKHHGHRAL